MPWMSPDIVLSEGQGWDARHVWITSFKEQGGEFTLKGHAGFAPGPNVNEK